ncbi:cation acetate symporter [Nakamurella sp.]|uniref:cation acetate symporter n=1 Tax=Nakamurella sp. TaxID=1869182 RepID=UPI0037848EED
MTLGNSTLSLVAIALVVVLTGVIGAYGVRFARTTNDFLVASRTVRPAWNAAAISGEYLSAASFLGVAGLIAVYGPDALWYPVGFTAGYLALQLFVAAPLRRSGAYTVPDFAEIRWGSRRLRGLATGLVLAIAWLYMVPLLHGAGLVLQQVTGLPRWVGVTVVAGVVTLNVVAGGMRSITLVQAFQYWFKVVAIAVPVLVAFAVTRPGVGELFTGAWAAAGTGLGGGSSAAEIYSLMLATFLGTMGLPHVLVRFYTNVDGGSARATTVRVIALLGVFYAFPTLAGVLMHRFMPPPGPGQADTLLLGLPAQVIGGWVGAVLAALVAAGAIAAFLSTSSGLVVAAAGVLSTDVLRGRVRDFRVSAVVAGLVPLLIALPTTSVDISRVVGMAFAVAASTFCPLLVLGIWWRGLTTAGAVAGLVVGGVISLGALATFVAFPAVSTGALESLLGQPAVVSVPASFATMVVVSLLTRSSVTARADAVLAQLHLPSAARRVGAP